MKLTYKSITKEEVLNRLKKVNKWEKRISGGLYLSIEITFDMFWLTVIDSFSRPSHCNSYKIDDLIEVINDEIKNHNNSIVVIKKIDLKLTKIELDVCLKICENVNIKDAAKKLSITFRECSNAVVKIYSKTKTNSKVGLVIWCIRNGIFTV